jgi:type IV secretion system protein VirB9
MRKMLAAICSAALLFAASPSQGALVPRPGAGDPRIAVVDYDPAQVVELRATMGYQIFIEFSPGEHIENVALGDATGWQITPNRAASLLFVKPISEGPATNMTVVTNDRHYAFELSVRPRTPSQDHSIIYTLRFQYPESGTATPAAAPAAPEPPLLPKVANGAYSYEGSPKIVPARVFDDGHATYFEFREGDNYPAIFSMDGEKKEAVVNTFMRGGYVVADMIGSVFVLRQGAEQTRIYNDGFHPALPGPQSPQPRPKHCWLCF